MRGACHTLAEQFAAELGYAARGGDVFARSCSHHEEWFYASSGVVRGIKEITPCVGVDVPSLSALTAMVPGLEKRPLPTFGGPIFRLGNLAIRPINDFVIKLRSSGDEVTALSQLRLLWTEFATPFLTKYNSSAAWLEAAESFLKDGKLGMLSVPSAGRTCMLLVAAARGTHAVPEVLERISILGAGGRPLQDYEEAKRLYDLICEQPDLIAGLRAAQSG